MANISIIGAGYVGLVTGLGFASKGHDVICVEKIKEKVDRIKSGKSTIYEKDLDKLLTKLVNKKFNITTDIKEAVLKTNITIVCVGTYSQQDGSVDLTQIKEVSKILGEILKNKKSYHLIVVKSTVVPTTTRISVIPILEKYSGKKSGRDFGVAVNPEFLREGHAIEDFLNPDRIVIGEYDKKSGDILESVYKEFDSNIIRTNLETAEMIKYASNSFLGLLISYSNELANLCENLGVDAKEVLEGLHYDNRLSPKVNGKKVFPGILSYLSPGAGFGGSCLPKDISAITKFAEEMNQDTPLLKSIMSINKSRAEHMVSYLEKELKNLRNRTVTVLGVSFKPDTDDIRDSPSIEIIKLLVNKGAKVKIYDPVAMDNARTVLKDTVTYANTLEDSLKNSEACMLVTNWSEFKKITNNSLLNLMKNPLIVDCRRFLDSKIFDNRVKYIGTGLGKL